jgi:hypothetical protein
MYSFLRMARHSDAPIEETTEVAIGSRLSRDGQRRTFSTGLLYRYDRDPLLSRVVF